MNTSGELIRGELMKKSLGSICLGAIMAMAFSYHAAAADLPEIEKSGTLKVATEDDYAPFNFMNNGQADGFNKDMLDELRKYAKFNVDQSILPWTGLLAAVSTGQYDMALTGAVLPTTVSRSLISRRRGRQRSTILSNARAIIH
jgi:polar amino acid transport system substrate-binding protein